MSTSRFLLLLLAMAGLCTGPLAAADAYILVDNQTGHILDSREANERRQVASLTKVATALVVLDMAGVNKLNLSEMVTVPPQAMSAGGVNPVGLAAGDQISVRDLLYCALLASDNVSAAALAYHAGQRLPNPEGLSPVENFVSHMNALAREIGMKRTLFLNPTGADSNMETPPHSTAADMARLTRYAYKDGDLPFYVSQKSRQIHAIRDGQELTVTITNTNQLLDQEGIDGVKTGRTSKAGDCLILTSDMKPEVMRDGDTTYVTPRRIIIVLLGSRDRFSDGLELTRRGWNLYGGWAREGRKTNRSKSL